jgi:hypothetical protein
LGVVHQVLTAVATGGASAELEEGGALAADAGEAAQAAEGAQAAEAAEGAQAAESAETAEGTEATEASECPSCRYEDTTTGNSIPNRTTDITRSEFEQNLRDSGFNETVSKDGKVSIFDNGAGQRYTLRDYSN